MFTIPLLFLIVTLSWQDNSNNEDGFIISRKDFNGQYTDIGKVAKDIIQYVDNASDGAYCYKVRAYNPEGNSDFTNEACTNYPLVGAVTLILQ